VVDKFADWLASGESQKAMDDLAAKVQEFGEWFSSPEGQKAFNEWIDGLKDLIKLAGDFLGLAKDVQDLFSGRLTKDKPGATPKAAPKFQEMTTLQQNNILGRTGNMALPSPNVNVYVDPITGKSVVKLLEREASRRGYTVGQMIQ